MAAYMIAVSLFCNNAALEKNRPACMKYMYECVKYMPQEDNTNFCAGMYVVKFLDGKLPKPSKPDENKQ